MKVFFFNALLHLYLRGVHAMGHHSTHVEVIGLLVGVSSLSIMGVLKIELWSSGFAAELSC